MAKKDKKKKAKKKSSSSSSSSSSSGDEDVEEGQQQMGQAASLPDPQDERRGALAEKENSNNVPVQADAEASKPPEEGSLEDYKKRKIAGMEALGRAGGVYVPPFKLARMQKEVTDKTSPQYQREVWEALRKSLNGLVNKVNVSNIKMLVQDLFSENLIRGRGLLARSIVRAQMASPGFTHIYAALVSILNSKLPEIGDLVARRVILQFRRAYKRNDKIVCTAATKMMAHLVNQKVVSELLALQVATLLLEKVTADSIEVASEFVKECGKVLTEVSREGSMAIFERFRGILHEGKIDKRVQYVIEALFEVRRKKYEDHPGVIEELDLVEEDDQVTHEIDLLDDDLKGEENLNIFKAQEPAQFKEDEDKWKKISNAILGESSSDEDDEEAGESEDSEEDEADQQKEEEKATLKIVDFTEQDQVNLRRTIYLCIMSSAHFEECVHKILKLNIKEGQETEVITMLIDCCAMERMFNRFFALQAERLCRLNPVYQELLDKAFLEQYETVHRLETNKLRNIGKFFAHQLYTDAISWALFQHIQLTEETTTSSSRIFIKVMLQELSENWGVKKLNDRFTDPDYADYFRGLFPRDHPKNIRFAINFFTAIGLGVLTEDLRGFLAKIQTQTQAGARSMAKGKKKGVASSSDDSDSDSDSSSSSSI